MFLAVNFSIKAEIVIKLKSYVKILQENWDNSNQICTPCRCGESRIELGKGMPNGGGHLERLRNWIKFNLSGDHVAQTKNTPTILNGEAEFDEELKIPVTMYYDKAKGAFQEKEKLF